MSAAHCAAATYDGGCGRGPLGARRDCAHWRRAARAGERRTGAGARGPAWPSRGGGAARELDRRRCAARAEAEGGGRASQPAAGSSAPQGGGGRGRGVRSQPSSPAALTAMADVHVAASHRLVPRHGRESAANSRGRAWRCPHATHRRVRHVRADTAMRRQARGGAAHSRARAGTEQQPEAASACACQFHATLYAHRMTTWIDRSCQSPAARRPASSEQQYPPPRPEDVPSRTPDSRPCQQLRSHVRSRNDRPHRLAHSPAFGEPPANRQTH